MKNYFVFHIFCANYEEQIYPFSYPFLSLKRLVNGLLHTIIYTFKTNTKAISAIERRVLQLITKPVFKSHSIDLTLKLVLILYFFLVSGSQNLAHAEEPVYFENYNEEQGLIHSYVLCMYQDSRGILWVGTYGGVQAFNGYNFNLFNVTGKKSNILTNHVVNVIFEDKDKNMWFGTENGLNKFNPFTGEVRQYYHNKLDSNSISNNNIKTIYQDENGLFWIGTYGGGLTKLDDSRKIYTHYRARSGDKRFLQSDLINTFFVDKDGLFWVGTENGGITVFDKNKKTVVFNFQREDGGLSHGTVNSIYQDIYDNFWIGTWEGGLNKYNPHTKAFSYFFPENKLVNEPNSKNIKSIIQTEKDFLWISIYGNGLSKFGLKTESFSKVNIEALKDGNSSQDLIWTLSRDNENNLWLGTFGKGLFKQNSLRKTFPFYSLKQPDDVKLSISSIIQDKNDLLWIGTLNRGIYTYNPKTITYVKFSPKKSINESISKLYLDKKNRIWIGADKALYVIYPDRKTIRRFVTNNQNPNSISESSVNAIMEDSQGNIWLGFWGMGINVIEQGELDKPRDEEVVFTKYLNNSNNSNTIPYTRIWSFFEDSKGTIWIGNSGELTYYSPIDKKFETLPIMVVSSFYEDAFGHLWVGSIGHGVFKLNKNKQVVKEYLLEDGLPCLDILAILADKNNRLWLGTSSGITVFDPQSESISNFDKYYGIQSFNINPNASILLSSGELVFGGNNGFHAFKPEGIGKDFIKSPIYITDIKLNNKSIAYENVTDSSATIRSSIANLENLQLDYKNKVLTIDFAAVNYSIPTSIAYSYMLEGFDEDWVTTTAANRSATYTNLDNGEYIFKVRISYSTGKWIDNTLKLKIYIKPPYWKQIWFRTILVLICIGVIWLAFRYKLGRKRLRMLISQKHSITEKLSREQEYLQIKNDQLNNSLEQLNRKIASISLKNQSVKDELKNIYQNLFEIKATQVNQNTSLLNRVLQSLNEKIDDLDETADFNDNVNLLFDDFIKRFADQFPKLTSTDIRICAFIRMNKSNKEIAKQLNITIGSLETSRHRIRKKLSLPTDINLHDFILRF